MSFGKSKERFLQVSYHHVHSMNTKGMRQSNPAFEGFYWHDIARIVLVHDEEHCKICEG